MRINEVLTRVDEDELIDIRCKVGIFVYKEQNGKSLIVTHSWITILEIC